MSLENQWKNSIISNNSEFYENIKKTIESTTNSIIINCYTKHQICVKRRENTMNEKNEHKLIQRLMRISKQCWSDSKNKLGTNADLTNMQYNICLAVSGCPGISQDGICKFLFMDKGSVAKLVSKLVAANLITRTVNPEDRREYRLFLTELGENVIRDLENNIIEWEEKIFGSKDDAFYQKLEALVTKIEDKMSK